MWKWYALVLAAGELREVKVPTDKDDKPEIILYDLKEMKERIILLFLLLS